MCIQYFTGDGGGVEVCVCVCAYGISPGMGEGLRRRRRNELYVSWIMRIYYSKGTNNENSTISDFLAVQYILTYPNPLGKNNFFFSIGTGFPGIPISIAIIMISS